MGRLWVGQGRHEAACQLLSEIYDWFVEGFSSPDLTEARELLAKLNRSPSK